MRVLRYLRRRFSFCAAFTSSLIVVLPLLLFLDVAQKSAALSGWAFLVNQTDCQLSCENGGVCAFDRDAPQRHKCICFIGMFYGERCEFAVSQEENDADAEHENENEELKLVEASSALKAGIFDPEPLAPIDNSPHYADTEGAGGSLDDAESESKDEKSEELSYESEMLLKGRKLAAAVASTTASLPTHNYGERNGDEVELLKEPDNYGINNNLAAAESHDEYSSLYATVAPTRNMENSYEDNYRNNLMGISTTQPYTSTIEQEDQQQQQNEDAVIDAADPNGPGTTKAGQPDEETLRTTHRVESAQHMRYIPFMDDQSTITRRKDHSKIRRKQQHRTSAHAAMSTTGAYPAQEVSLEDDDEGWMISGKRRVSLSAPSHACKCSTNFFYAAALLATTALRFVVSRQI